MAQDLVGAGSVPDGVISLSMQASLFRRYCCDGSGAEASMREHLVRHGTVGELSDHLFALDDEAFEEHFIATDIADLRRDNLLAMRAEGQIG